MNILIPDEWLREYLDTEARPDDIARCLSLCGPSVERISEIAGQPVYDIEITTNRIDAYSVFGIAREAAVILPEFGFKAKLNEPDLGRGKFTGKSELDIRIVNDPGLVSRILAVRLSGYRAQPSAPVIRQRLEAVGQRPLEAMVDLTNYVMWEIGHPVHAFDYHSLKTKKIIVRTAKKGESFITLDGKKFTTYGGEIVFDDGRGQIIDLPSIMGTKNTVITQDTTDVLLFIENSDPAKIRFASMTHGIRTQAAVINEKHPDVTTARTAFDRTLALALTVPGVRQASQIFDLTEKFPGPERVTVTKKHLEMYLGESVKTESVLSVLSRLGMTVAVSGKNDPLFTVTPPSWRQDLKIAEDIIEEVARIKGYHKIPSLLPKGELPDSLPDPVLTLEMKIKEILKGFGLTEFKTYSMISEALTNKYRIDKRSLYRIKNELSRDYVYLRPTLAPSVLGAIAGNLPFCSQLAAFEISPVYQTVPGELPSENPQLFIAGSGCDYRYFRGLVEGLFQELTLAPEENAAGESCPVFLEKKATVSFSGLGFLGRINPDFRVYHGLPEASFAAVFNLSDIINHGQTGKTYVPVPKFPAAYEDLSLIVPGNFGTGKLLTEIKKFHPLIVATELVDIHGNSRTFRVTFRSKDHNLTGPELQTIRHALLKYLNQTAGAVLKV